MKTTMTFSALAIAGALALSATTAYAHHGVNGQFDTAKSMEVTGVVTRVRFVNPHSYVYFDVKNADGETDAWRCELRSGSLLKRKGWTTNMFAKGTTITINGSPARNEPNTCYTKTITFEDGNKIGRQDTLDSDGKVVIPPRELTLDDGVTPNINGTWAAAQPERPPGGDRRGRPPATANGEQPAKADRAERRGPPPGAGGPRVTRTAAGNAAVEGFKREDNPRFHCEATNIFADWWFDQMVNKIEQTNDDITLTYGFMDIVRTIHLDMDKHPENITPSITGHSIGKWVDGVLVVDTVGFAEGYLVVTPREDGVAKHSTQLHVEERFTLSEDGKTLTREYTATDPLYIVGTYTGKDVVKLTTFDYEPYSCDDLTGDTF